MNHTKKLFGLVVCVAGALAFTAATTQAQNLVVDPSFESGAITQPNPIPVPAGVGAGWAQFGGSIATPTAHSGIYSAQIADNGWNPRGVYQLLNASAGQTYELSAWYMTPNPGVAGYATPALVQISFFDGAGTGIGAFGNWQPLGAANTWVLSPTVVAAAPAGTAYIGAYLMMMDNNGANGLQFYYDDATLVQIPEPSSLVLLGLGIGSAFIWRRRQ
jgi:hypothetical protein